MNTNSTNNTNYRSYKSKLVFPELSYLITGICFDIHNSIGRYSREKQYCDALEEKFKELEIPYKRELSIKGTGNSLDFLIEDKVALEIKAKPLVVKSDYYQIQRYLQISEIKLGLIINFRNRYLKPIRVLKIDTDARNKFL